MAQLLVIVAGLVLGSFLNVCIYRVPRGLSVVRPGSRCPHCERPIRPRENVPLLSFLLQQGRCRGCGNRIGWVYPTVEAMTGLVFWLLYLKYGLTAPFFLNGLFSSILIALVFIDLYHRILPDVFTLGGTLVGFLLAPIQSPEFLLWGATLQPGGPILNSYLNSLVGIVFGGGILWGVAFLYLKLRRVEGLGFGDVKMMGMVGAFLGWQFAWLTILVGSLLGAVFGGLFILLSNRDRRYELPFGSFLGLAALGVTLVGSALLGWYVDHL